MRETHISFYLKENRIRIFVEMLRAIGQPSRICFMIDEDGATLMVAQYGKRDFISHKVPSGIYNGTASMKINSYKLCRIIADLHNWDLSQSYRVPGKVYPDKKVAIFNLKAAENIARKE